MQRAQDLDAAAITLENAASLRRLQREVRRLSAPSAGASNFVGTSGPMKRLFDTIERVAPHDVSVLIRGESGTGKELVARQIHANSQRSKHPFIAINCGAIPESLVDSELFGHVRGAFTGAVESRIGAFESANDGILFLDEIGDIPLPVQTRLLRVLQEQEIHRVGGGPSIKINVRVLAATLVDLEAAIENSSFRSDLYYRLNMVTLDLPPCATTSMTCQCWLHFYSRNTPGNSTSERRDCLLEPLRYSWPTVGPATCEN